MFQTVEQVKEYIFGGYAIFTIKSTRTQKHFTYKVRRPKTTDETKPPRDIWFVHQLAGQSSWNYLGIIDPKEKRFYATRKTLSHHKRGEGFEGFQWLIDKILAAGVLPKDVEVFHTNKCGMCGRTLTDPISVAEGFGPECRSKRLNRPMGDEPTLL